MSQAEVSGGSASFTRRMTVIDCADWPVIGAGRRQDQVVAVVAANRVVSASAAARLVGVSPGLRRREAERRVPGLEVVAPDPAAEARSFAGVLAALDDVTPRVEVERPGRCAFLTRGPSRYFGGDQALGQQIHAAITEAIGTATEIRVGTADGRFAALQAGLRNPIDGVGSGVIPVGQSAAFLSVLPVSHLGDFVETPSVVKEIDDLLGVLGRLGLNTLGDFAALRSADVVARFGAIGRRAHLWANGHDDRPAQACDPEPDLEVAVELDPPVQRVDQAAFVARALADDFLRRLGARGASCARVGIGVETEHGESQERLWRSDQTFSSAAIADRMRWQLDGWLGGPIHQRPTGGLSRLYLRPDELGAATGRQLGFWGEQTHLAERAARAVARVQGLVAPEAVSVPEVKGGRNPGDMVQPLSATAVDLVERSTAADRAEATSQQGSPFAGVGEPPGVGVWPGRLPAPAPAVVPELAVRVAVTDAGGVPLEVSGRGLLSGDPAWLVPAGRPGLAVVRWSSPWLVDERWWQPDQANRCARMQMVLGDGRAVCVRCDRGVWAIEAIYD